MPEQRAGRTNGTMNLLVSHPAGRSHAPLCAPRGRAGLRLLLNDALRCQAGRSRPRSPSPRRDAALHEDKKPPFPTSLKYKKDDVSRGAREGAQRARRPGQRGPAEAAAGLAAAAALPKRGPRGAGALLARGSVSRSAARPLPLPFPPRGGRRPGPPLEGGLAMPIPGPRRALPARRRAINYSNETAAAPPN